MTPTHTRQPADQSARDRISCVLDRTLFVEAGAGSGKTTALVARVLALINDEVPMDAIAAITFTEKAAAELRDRIRQQLEEKRHSSDSSRDRRIAGTALQQLDSAAVGTLHSFAQRILTDHPVEAGLPPDVRVLDEIASQIEFNKRWRDFINELLDDTAMSDPLLLMEALGVSLYHVRVLASVFDENWDEVADHYSKGWVDGEVNVSTTQALSDAKLVLGLLQQTLSLQEHCCDPDDKLLEVFVAIGKHLDRLASLSEDDDLGWIVGSLQALFYDCKNTHKGRAANWDGHIFEARQSVRDLKEVCQQAVRPHVQAALAKLTERLAKFTLDAAEQRRASGQLEFHDLLVRARDLLRHPQHGRAVRTALRDRYQRLLLDEFQDTDPIQIELAVLLASSPDTPANHTPPTTPSDTPASHLTSPDTPDTPTIHTTSPDTPDTPASHPTSPDTPDTPTGHTHWSDFKCDPARLFFVGDPKQSIYRFRRADIATYLQAREYVRSGGGSVETLTTNFRCGRALIDWVNHIFEGLIQFSDGSQPEYTPLTTWREDAPKGPGVTVMGASPVELPSKGQADALRAKEAEAVAAVIEHILEDGWSVADDEGGWRQALPSDIAILIPARTSMSALERALQEKSLPYRAETSSLVYNTREVRDLLMAVQALADPTDELALVSALRSPLYGCGDDDLAHWKLGLNGSFSLMRKIPEDAEEDHPVAESLRHLQKLRDAKRWVSPPQLLEQIIRERGLYEAAVASRRPRDVWRRLRYVVDQARAWCDAGGSDLRSYLEWARLQGDERARVTETVLPETDDDSVRILTVHGAKGLEFPIVVMSGMTSPMASPHRGPTVGFPDGLPPVMRLKFAVESEDFETWKELDLQMDHHEKLRLLYVACTRARDHLVLSLFRSTRERKTNPPPASMLANAGAAEIEGVYHFEVEEVSEDSAADGLDRAATPIPTKALPDRHEWRQELALRLEQASAPTVISPTRLAILNLAPESPDDTASAVKADTADDSAGDVKAGGADDGAGYAKAGGADVNGAGVAGAGRDDSTIENVSADGGEGAVAESDSGVESDPGLAKDHSDTEQSPWQKGRYGTSVGKAVHAVLQTVDLATGEGLEEEARHQVNAEGISRQRKLVTDLAKSALATNTARQAAASPYWRELYVAAPISDDCETLVEGYIDLMYRSKDGLVVVDWKTDALSSDTDTAAKLARYRLQGAGYAAAVEAVTGETVARMEFVFLNRDTEPVVAPIEDLRAAIDEVKQKVAELASPTMPPALAN